MNELYGISYVLIRHPSRPRCFLFFKFIIDGLFMARGAPVPSPPAKRGRPAKEVPVEIEAMGAKEKEKADKAAKEKPKECVCV